MLKMQNPGLRIESFHGNTSFSFPDPSFPSFQVFIPVSQEAGGFSFVPGGISKGSRCTLASENIAKVSHGILVPCQQEKGTSCTTKRLCGWEYDLLSLWHIVKFS